MSDLYKKLQISTYDTNVKFEDSAAIRSSYADKTHTEMRFSDSGNIQSVLIHQSLHFENLTEKYCEEEKVPIPQTPTKSSLERLQGGE